ncbi:uncharacterized protein TNCT_705681 [Trichonephila clavata]|uniref:Uncharacterized protein n=1 Tax=Trichonephila clavata TaxID=2740835 RepID=A0A8X6EXF0_TRICU|nr:uncharacterized protein TNCT_705681 [Trichonephila clavata]
MLIYVVFVSVILAFGADITHVNGVPHTNVVDSLQKNIYKETECECGEFSQSCHFDERGNKVCECLPGYAQANGTCFECDCGEHVKTCEFDQDGNKKCNCDHKYAQRYGKCELCDCGKYAISCYYYYRNTKTCFCPYGFTQRNGVCARP